MHDLESRIEVTLNNYDKALSGNDDSIINELLAELNALLDMLPSNEIKIITK